MAYDAKLAERIRKLISKHPKPTEREMFGGIGFMLRGNMAVGVAGDELIVRIPKEATEAALKAKGTRAFDLSSRPAPGWILVHKRVLATPAQLKAWVQRGVDYSLSLPPK